jgi:hypothetical protein
MATRSTIAVQHQDGTVSQIYAHWDGYLSNNGNILYNSYTSCEQVEALVALGDVSSLSDTIDDTEFYMRDRDEVDDCDARKFDSLDAFYLNYQEEDYNYLFANGLWLVEFHLTNRKFILLSEAFTLKELNEDEE